MKYSKVWLRTRPDAEIEMLRKLIKIGVFQAAELTADQKALARRILAEGKKRERRAARTLALNAPAV